MAESYSLEAILSARDTNFTSTMQSAQGAMGNMAKASSSFGSTMKGVVSGLGVFKIASAAVGAVTGSIDNAISRVDTLANSARVFENMGFSASETESMMESLNDSITGLPTSLNDAVSGVQLLASAVGDIGKSQEVFSAMNNAILGFGGTAGMVDNAIVQLSQAFSNGKIDAQTWNSMINSGLGPALNALAKEMGYTTGEFKAYLSDGTISVEEFQDALITLDKDGGGGLKSLQQIAQDSTKGIATSLANARTSITRGVANIITAIDKGLSNAGLGSISDIITGIGKAAERMLTGLAGGIEKLGNFIAPLVAGFKSVMEPIGVATEALGAFQSATDELTSSVADVTSIFAEWDSLSLEEKQATVSTMGQEEMEELLVLLGVDFDAIPDEYTKEAYLNAYGKDALEELLWVTGEWHNLTLEEKRAVLEAQIENDEIREAIESMELWENTEFYSKFADINMNDNDSGQQILDLINNYRELDGQEPIELEVDVKTKPAEKAIDGFVSTFKKFGKSVGKITKGIVRIMEKTGKFFAPVFDFLGDASKASLKTLGKYVDATGQLFEGDWSGAWSTFKSATVESLTDVVSSLKTNVPKMWDAMKVTAGNVWNWFDNISWSSVYDTINGLFNDMGAVIATIDWVAVAGEVGGVVGDFVGKTKGWLDDNVPKAIDWVQDVLLNPNSQLNKDAGAFKDEVERMVKSFIDGLGIKESIMEWVVKVNAKPFFDWGSWQDEIDTIMGFFESEDYEQEVMLDISIQRSQGRSEDEIQQIIDTQYGEGSYQKHVDLQVNTQIEYEQGKIQQQIDQMQSIIDAQIAEMGGDGQDVIVTKGLIIQILKDSGANDQEIDAYIQSLKPDKQQIEVDIEPVSSIEPAGGWLDGVLGSIGDMFKGKTVSAQIDIKPVASVAGGSSSADAAGGFTAPEPPQIDFSGMIADAQSAMQEVNQTITNGMTNVASAVRIGTVMMNTAFRSGMNQAVVTAQNTANRVLSAFNNLSSNLYSAGVMAGAGFRNGLASQQASIVSTAQSIANSVSNTIQSALRIASPSKVTTYLGEMVGAGLIAGMDGMVAGVESSANRLSLATLPTTDLGSSRYGGSISGQSTSSKLDEVIDAINRGQVIMMDSGALVGETSRQMDVALGQRGSLGGRHKL